MLIVMNELVSMLTGLFTLVFVSMFAVGCWFGMTWFLTK